MEAQRRCGGHHGGQWRRQSEGDGGGKGSAGTESKCETAEVHAGAGGEAVIPTPRPTMPPSPLCA